MHKILMYKIGQIITVAAAVISFWGLTGCGSSSCNSEVNVNTQSAITIDNAGTIPVFGNSSSSTVVYVHNNTNSSISGISYTMVVNTAHTKFSTRLNSLLKNSRNLASIDASQCATIAAGQGCPITIVTPLLTDGSMQGSFEIKANYLLNNLQQSFTQLINYAQIQNNTQTEGAKFQSGATISGYGNNIGYATIYLYGSGQNQLYTVNELTTNQPSVSIINGNISGQQIQSNFVQAVEISAPISSSALSANVTVLSKSLESSNLFTDKASIQVVSTATGALLNVGNVPYIDTAQESNGMMIVQNSGNTNAVVGNITADAGINSLSGCSGAVLAPAASCIIKFNVTGSAGNGQITVAYSSGTTNSKIAGDITWFNSSNSAVASISIANNPLTFTATIGATTTVTVSNIGDYAFNHINIPQPVTLGGHASATIVNDHCSAVTSLAVGASCSYDIVVTDNEVDNNQQIRLGFAAKYTNISGAQDYSNSSLLTYTSTPNRAVISISPFSSNMAISGNKVESITQILTVSNNGSLTANLTSIELKDNPAFLNVESSTCGATLKVKSSCNVFLKLGPVFSREESAGIATLFIDYTSSGDPHSESANSSINWTIQPYYQRISLIEQSAFGATGGNGETAESKYIFTARGRDVIGKSITLTYQNTGTHAMKITGIQDNSSVYAWRIGGNGTTCLAGSTILAPNDTCKIVYDNVLESNILALGAVGTAYEEDLSLPLFIYQDVESVGIQFKGIPNLANGSYSIYAQSNQGTLANSLILNGAGTSNESITVSHLLANVDDILYVTVTTKMEDYFETQPPGGTPSACSYSSANGIMTQTCVMGKDNLSVSASYKVNQNYLTKDQLKLTALFSVDNLSQIVSMNPLGAQLDLGTVPAFVTVGTGGTILSSHDGVNWESSTISTDYFNGVTFADNKYVAVGSNGVIFTSSNALSWITQNSGTAQELFEVTYGNNLFVSVGCHGTIITSPTAINWSLQTGINLCDIYGVTYGNGLYIATGQGGYIQTSPNAITWTEQSSPTSEELTAVNYGGGKYIAVGTNGTILYSVNGSDWNSANSGISAQIGAVTYADNQYVAVTREGGVLTSLDGITWSQQTTNNLNPLYGIAYANGKFVAVGTMGTILTSSDAITWTTQTSITNESLYGITSLN